MSYKFRWTSGRSGEEQLSAFIIHLDGKDVEESGYVLM